MGEMAIETISKFKADKAFISAQGINFGVGVTAIGSPQMQVKKAILSGVDDVYLLVDSSKVGGFPFCPHFEKTGAKKQETFL